MKEYVGIYIKTEKAHEQTNKTDSKQTCSIVVVVGIPSSSVVSSVKCILQLSVKSAIIIIHQIVKSKPL